MKYADFGSVSCATMRPEDLIPAFASTLDDLLRQQPKSFRRMEYRKLIREANAISDYDSEDAGYVLDELFAKLEDFAPAYAYFGSHEGDGSDYGFWLAIDIVHFDGLRVDDTSEVPADYSGEVLHINDHGNMTLYEARRGKLKEVWAIV